MEGSNEIKMCPAELHKAIQFYLNDQVLRPEHKVRVISVKEESTGYASTFIIKVDSTVEVPKK